MQQNNKCLIVDNEITSIRNLESFIKRYSKLEVISSAFNIDEALNVLSSEKIDIIFLDVELDDELGFDLIKKLDNQKNNYLIIIYSAYKEYGVEAIRNRVFDYLLKPIDKNNFIQVINHIEQEIDKREKINVSEIFTPNKDASIIPVKLGTIMFDAKCIIKIEAMGSYSKIHFLFKGKLNNKIVTLGLYQIKNIINYEFFIQTNRNDIVNLNYLVHINNNEKCTLEIQHIGQVIVSRRRKNEVIAQIQKLA